MAWGLCHRHRFPSRADRPYRSRRDRSLIDGTFELFRYAAGRGPVIGAGAIALGVRGADAVDAVGDQLDDTLSHGLPTDELYVYRDALQKGRSIVIVMVEDDAQATQGASAHRRPGRGERGRRPGGVVDRPPRCRGGGVHAPGRRLPEGRAAFRSTSRSRPGASAPRATCPATTPTSSTSAGPRRSSLPAASAGSESLGLHARPSFVAAAIAREAFYNIASFPGTYDTLVSALK
jgi:hypothetical protein